MFEMTVMQVNSIITALPLEWKKVIKANVPPSINFNYNYEILMSKPKPVSFMYSELNYNENPVRDACNKWNRKTNMNLEADEYCSFLANINRLTTSIKLRSFLYRYFHTVIILNQSLFKWKMKRSDMCTFCGLHGESFLHFFWECKTTQETYKWAYEFCTDQESCVPIIVILAEFVKIERSLTNNFI